MAQINFAKGEVQCKIVYYGPAESGKTANLRTIHERSPERIRGKLTTIATDTNRTLFFDFLPLNLGKVANIRTKLNLYAVPYIDGRNTLRVLVLEGVDGIVFVADARKERLEANREALANLRANLVELGRDPDEVPIVFQANKMDLEGAVEAARLADALDLAGSVAIDATATEGVGVLPSLKSLTGQVLDNVAGMMRGTEAPAPKPAESVAPVAAPTPKQPAVPVADEPVFTPAWHRSAPDEPETASFASAGLPATPKHRPSPGITHDNQPATPVEPDPIVQPEVPVRPAASTTPSPRPSPEPAQAVPDLKKTVQEVEGSAQWDDGPVTDPFMEASNEEQPFPAAGGGMADVSEPAPAPVVPANEPETRPGRAVYVGAGGTRGRVRSKSLPAFGWGQVDLAPTRKRDSSRTKKRAGVRPVGDRRQRQRPTWRADPPSAKKMTAGAMAALVWLAVTGFLVFELL